MRLLITGGTGFIGSGTALRARRLGHAVRVTGLRRTPFEAANIERLRAAGVEVALADLEELAASPRLLEGVDTVLHLAAAQHEMNVPDAHFQAVNVQGTEALVNACLRAGVGRFVHGSTIGVYGRCQGEIDETTPTAPDNVYARTKLEGENVVLARRRELPAVVIRIPETYGPGDRRLLKLFRGIAQGTFFRIGGGSNLHHPIYIDDLVQGLLLAAEHPAAPGELFLLPGCDAVTTDGMIAAVAAAVGRAPPWLRLPAWPLLAAAVALEAGLRPLGIQPPLHRRRMDFFVKSFRFDGGKARRLLGFAPQIPFREGAARTARWYEEVGELPTPDGRQRGVGPRAVCR
jgi:nucleoside-diphosphate-sugar epimerase